MTLADDLQANADAFDQAAAALVSEHEAARVDYAVQMASATAYMRTLVNQARPKVPGIAAALDTQLDGIEAMFDVMRDRQVAAVAAWEAALPQLTADRQALIDAVRAAEPEPDPDPPPPPPPDPEFDPRSLAPENTGVVGAYNAGLIDTHPDTWPVESTSISTKGTGTAANPEIIEKRSTTGQVLISHSHVVVRYVRANPARTSAHVFRIMVPDLENVRLEYCEGFQSDAKGGYGNGLSQNYEAGVEDGLVAYRCDFHGTGDGIRASGGILVDECRIHLPVLASDYGALGMEKPHADGVQQRKGERFPAKYRNSSFLTPKSGGNAAFFINSSAGPMVAPVDITGCYVNGQYLNPDNASGVKLFYFEHKTYPFASTITVAENIIEYHEDSSGPQNVWTLANAGTLVREGNVYQDGTPVPDSA